jgi:arginyl-tRNA synthetase
MDKKQSYLGLSKLTYNVIKELLNVLAIDMIEKM